MDGEFDVSNNGNLDGLTLHVSLGSTDASALGTAEGIKLVSPDDEVLSITVWDEDAITLGTDEGIELGFIDWYFYGSNYDKLKDTLLGDLNETDDLTDIGSLDGGLGRIYDGNFDC